MKRDRGFTMVELLIAIEIILIMVAIAFPQIRRAYASANEASAAGSMRNISQAQAQFKTATFRDDDGDGEGDYASLAQLANPDGAGTTPPFIDPALATGVKSGYRFLVTVTPGTVTSPPLYNCLAVPVDPGGTGYKIYYVDDSGVIRYTADGSLAGPTAPPIS